MAMLSCMQGQPFEYPEKIVKGRERILNKIVKPTKPKTEGNQIVVHSIFHDINAGEENRSLVQFQLLSVSRKIDIMMLKMKMKISLLYFQT